MTKESKETQPKHPPDICPPTQNNLGFIPELIKTCRFTIKSDNHNDSFELKVWDLNERQGSHHKLAFRFNHTRSDKNSNKKTTKCIFYNEGFGCPGSMAVDSKETIYSILTFITLRPGDIENEYFEEYNEDQLEFIDNFAEEINFRASAKFGPKKEYH